MTLNIRFDKNLFWTEIGLFSINYQIKFKFQEKDEFIKETMNLDISGKLKIKLAMGSGTADINGDGAYAINEDASNKTHSMILTFKHVSYIEEVKTISYKKKQEEFTQTKVLKSALKNKDQVTHVVTYIEYGSLLHIELEYEGKNINRSQQISIKFFSKREWKRKTYKGKLGNCTFKNQEQKQWWSR